MHPEARGLLKLPENPAGTAQRASTREQEGLARGLGAGGCAPQTKAGLEVTAEPAWEQRDLTLQWDQSRAPEVNSTLSLSFRALLAALQYGILAEP